MFNIFLDRLFFSCAGGYSENHEDEESVEAPAAFGRSAEPAFLKVQTTGPCHQGNWTPAAFLHVRVIKPSSGPGC